MNSIKSGGEDSCGIAVYDVTKCFDSLWAQECINDLWDAGCRDDKLKVLEGTARYADFLLAPAEGFGLRPILFGPSSLSFSCPEANKKYFIVDQVRQWIPSGPR